MHNTALYECGLVHITEHYMLVERLVLSTSSLGAPRRFTYRRRRLRHRIVYESQHPISATTTTITRRTIERDFVLWKLFVLSCFSDRFYLTFFSTQETWTYYIHRDLCTSLGIICEESF